MTQELDPEVRKLGQRILSLEQDRWKEERNEKINGTLLVQIDERQKQVLKELGKITGNLENLVKKQDGFSVAQSACAATQEERWKHHDAEHQQLNTRKNLGDAGAGAVGLLGAFMAWVLGSN